MSRLSPLQTRLRYLLSVLTVLVVVALLAGVYAWWQMRGSLPQLEGELALADLGAPVKIERDALGVPTITGETRVDVARASGFVHAQDRFFQMDLLRRTGAGELAEIFGATAVPLDRAHRLHGFRRTAEKVLAALPAERRALLDAYTAGVNAGLASLGKAPWEYLVLRTTPAAWRAEDSLLVIYAMWFDLQDATGGLERSVYALRSTRGQTAVDFFAPLGNSWDAALDGSTIPAAPLPPWRLKPATGTQASTAAPVTFAEARQLPGSNSFAVAGTHTASGAALLANDMHLGLNVPNIWYRAALHWKDATGGAQQVMGVMLAGTPAMIVGSNGRIAWGFTNSYVDTADIVLTETEATAGIHYRALRGWVEIEDRAESITVNGEEPVAFVSRWTEWGPILAGPELGRYLVLRWNAHNPESTNLNLMELETAGTTAEAIAVGHRAGMPNQNLLVADAAGAIGWTVSGTVPRRVGYSGREPVSWAFGDRQWQGWLNPSEIPAVENPVEGFLFTANQRVVGGAALARLGDNGYDDGARARQIRDGLSALVASGKKVEPADLLAIQRDDRAVFLERWQKFLLEVLTDEAVAKNKARAGLREVVQQWNGHASIDSAAYRVVRSFRLALAGRALAPFFAGAQDQYENFSYSQFHYEDALWQLVQEKPVRLLNPAHRSWENLLLAAADDVIALADQDGTPLQRFTWGAYNTLRMRHPFSSFLPKPLARLLDMPAEPLPGGDDMPFIQRAAFGASERLVVSPGRESEGIFQMPGGQSGHPLSPYYRAGHDAWVKGEPSPFLPGAAQHTLTLKP